MINCISKLLLNEMICIKLSRDIWIEYNGFVKIKEMHTK